MLIEALWRWLHEDATYQHCPASLDGLETDVANFQGASMRIPSLWPTASCSSCPSTRMWRNFGSQN